MGRKRVNCTVAKGYSTCGCDLYVRQERVKRTAVKQSPVGVTCM